MGFRLTCKVILHKNGDPIRGRRFYGKIFPELTGHIYFTVLKLLAADQALVDVPLDALTLQ